MTSEHSDEIRPADNVRIHLALDALVEGIESIDRRAPCVELSICVTPETFDSLQALYGQGVHDS